MTRRPHVRVKPGVLDEEFGGDMGGWSGRVIKREGNLLTIKPVELCKALLEEAVFVCVTLVAGAERKRWKNT